MGHERTGHSGPYADTETVEKERPVEKYSILGARVKGCEGSEHYALSLPDVRDEGLSLSPM